LSERTDLVLIATFPSVEEAYLAKAKLEWNGIASFVADVGTISANPGLTVAVGYPKLYVASCDVDAARGVLGDS
jgi:hypothetical protein